MRFEKKFVRLKDGSEAILRSPAPEDAAAMLEYLKRTSSETDFMLRYPEECTMTVEAESAFLQRILDDPNSMMILCEVDGQITGNCSLSRHPFIKTHHRADVAIGILRSHWSKGIGTAMFCELIDTARNSGIAQLELEVIEGNNRAITLYEKMGFRTVAQRPNSIRLKDGTSLREFIMIKQLEDDNVPV